MFSIVIITWILLGSSGGIINGDVKAMVDISLSPSEVRVGDNVNFGVMITNTVNRPLTITSVGLHFDWMTDDSYYYSSDVSDNNPYTLQSNESATFYIRSVSIPTNIAVDTYHSVNVSVVIEDTTQGIIWQLSSLKSVFVYSGYTVSGYVTDATTGDGIGRATVRIGGYFTTTYYVTGYYSIDNIKEGTYIITVDADGYQSSSKTITVNDDIEVDFQLTPSSFTVSGYVTDANTGDSIDGATVSIGSYSSTTDYDGYYSISGIKEGTYTITVNADGYQSSSKTVTVNDNIEVNFQLTPSSSGGGGNNGGGSGTTNGPGSSGGLDWLIPLLIFLVIIIVIIVAVVAILSSKKKNVPQSQVPPPPSMGESNQEIQSTTKICPYCGREIPADAKICPYCGNKL